MGVPPSDAGRLSLWEYQGMLWHWNEAHKTDDAPDAAPPPDADRVRANLAAINARLNRTP